VLDSLPHLTIALSLAALFATAAVHKLFTLAEWPGVVRNYQLVPATLADAAAGTVLAAEVLVAGALLWTPTRVAGACAAALLLVTYAAAIGINLRRGRTSIDCGCFGLRLRQGISAWMVRRNLLLALLALVLLLSTNGRSPSLTEYAMAAVFVVTLAFLYPVLGIVLNPPPPTFEQNFRAALGERAHR